MKRIIPTYIFITFLVTWTITFLIYFLFRQEIISRVQLDLLYNFGALGPFLGGVISARIFYGRAGVKKLFGAVRFRGLNKLSLLPAVSPLLFFAAAFLIYPLFAGHWFTFAETQRQFDLGSPVSYVCWLLPFITYSLLEEFGWRGFLLPHLQQRYTAIKATIILTIFWAGWHLPFFLWRFDFSLFIGFGFFFSIFIGSVLITSIFNSARGSLVPVILFHFSNNVASALDKEYVVAIVSTGVIFLAITFFKKYGSENLSPIQRTGNFYLDSNG
jgi:membrane protease YdiL (CAAX protease family)